ncbi:MAG: hypothetical protein RIF46_09360 [Cyclobacteriaceae bacterium]
MPYIKPEQREKLDELVARMEELGIAANGDLNYVLYAYCKRHVQPSYNNYKNFIGELHQCATEIERRLLGPYEDEKIKENGDV